MISVYAIKGCATEERSTIARIKERAATETPWCSISFRSSNVADVIFDPVPGSCVNFQPMA